MMAKQQLGSLKKAYKLGRGQLRYLHNRARYWRFILAEGRRLWVLKDIHAGERCFIIGNGPSIRQQDLTQLRDEVTFVTNMFFLHEQFDELNVNYYCVSDPSRWLSGGFPDKFYQRLNDNRCVNFLEYSAKRLVRTQGLFRDHYVYFLWLNDRKLVREGHVNLDISKNVFWGHTVVIDFCLPIVYYMGFREVYLLGCDCDYRLSEAPDFSKAYFYNINEDPSSKAPVEVLANHAPHWIFAAYETMKYAFESQGRRIFNAGIGGKLEVFERVSFEEILKSPN